MARTAEQFVRDMRRLGRTDEQIVSVATVARNGGWLADVQKLLVKTPKGENRESGGEKVPKGENREEISPVSEKTDDCRISEIEIESEDYDTPLDLEEL